MKSNKILPPTWLKSTSPTKLFSASLLTLALLSGCNSTQSEDTNTLSSASTITLKAPAATLIDSKTATKDELVIPYQKYRLPNGLTIVLHPDKSDPLVHVDVTYHVGSSREELGKSGFAHFFEHMMFQGSKNVADEQHFKIITESGGNLNGTTNTDRTNYYQTVPKNQLEKVLWLESDRMGFLLDAVTEPKFEIQRATVKNERGQNVDNRPYGRLNETVNQVIYPREHPYSWPVIGYMVDIDRADVNDLRHFFQRWYGPNNAVLTIGGDFDTEQTLAWIEKYFGEIPRGPEVKPLERPLISFDEHRYTSMTDNVSLPLIYISYPTVYGFHKDEAALDVLANILGSGSTSILYKNLVKNGLAVQAGASHPCSELGCTLSLYALPNPQQGMSLTKLEQEINKSIAEFVERGITDDDLHKVKTAIETSTIYGLQSVSGKVSTLAFNETFTGSPDRSQQEIERYRNVTKADVLDVFNRYIKNKGAAIVSVVPMGQEQFIAAPDNFELVDITKVEEVEKDEAEVVLNTSSFDRSVIPPSGANPQVKVPDFWRSKLANGIDIIASENSETPTITLTLNLEGGPLLDPLEKAGLASMTAAMMNESTQNFNKEALSHALEMLGSSISFSASGRYTSVRLSSLTKNFEQSLALMEEMLFKPAFDEQDFARLKMQSIQGLEHALKNPSTIARNTFKEMLYGKENRVALPGSGNLSTIDKITLSDVKDFYSKYYNPAHATIVVVGDFDEKKLVKELGFLASWQVKPYQIPSFSDFPAEVANVIHFVDHEGAKQSVIRIGRKAMPYDADGDYFKAGLMNFPLGGAFNSRINLNLREDKGYTYGARSGFNGGKTLGSFVASASVKIEHTADALTEMLGEIERMQTNGMSKDELNFMRQAISQNDALNYETQGQKAGFLRQLQAFDLARDYRQKQTQIINKIGLDELNAIARDELAKPMQILIVGDMNVIGEQLKALNMPLVEVEPTR